MAVHVRTVNHDRPALASFDLETQEELLRLRSEDITGYLSSLRDYGRIAAQDLLSVVPSELGSVDEVLEAVASLSNQFRPQDRPYLEQGILEGLTGDNNV